MNTLRNVILALAIILPNFASAQSNSKAGETGVYLLRADSSFYNTPFIAIDDKPVGGINSSSYLFTRLQPGTHQLAINQGYLDGTVHYQFQVKPGQITYLNMAWGKLPKNQKTTAPSVDKIFATNRGWVIVEMNEQAAKGLLSQLN